MSPKKALKYMKTTILDALVFSKDDSTKVGAKIISEDNEPLAMGYNGFPRGINDNVEKRKQRPIKYKWSEHAERNAIYNTSANLKGSTMIVTDMPCCDCARAIVQKKIKTVITLDPSPDMKLRWSEDFEITQEMFAEAGVELIVLPYTKAQLMQELMLEIGQFIDHENNKNNAVLLGAPSP